MLSQSVQSLVILAGREQDGVADLAGKVELLCAGYPSRPYNVVVDVRTLIRSGRSGDSFHISTEKIALFEAISRLDVASTGGVLLPDIECHSFLSELLPVCEVPLISIAQAFVSHVLASYPDVRRIGLLASASIRGARLLESCFNEAGLELIFPEGSYTGELDVAIDALEAEKGTAATAVQAKNTRAFEVACEKLIADGAQLILPAHHRLFVGLLALQKSGKQLLVPVVDTNLAYAQYAVTGIYTRPRSAFKVGVLGGVGPAATVSFLDKLMRATPATRDQEHLKVVVEQNPQIPDRTEHLIGNGSDPTIELFATCKKLQDAHADIIAIPCNTAHAYVEYIQPMLNIPIVHMLRETVAFITSNYDRVKTIGLLATNGTVRSRVYHKEIEGAGLIAITPSEAVQKTVMDAIYGPVGVKAGFIDEHCRTDLCDAVAHLVARGAEIVILGCTELPLLIAEDLNFTLGGTAVPIVDPAEVLARRCIELSQSSKKRISSKR
jgi:aspartate racemase